MGCISIFLIYETIILLDQLYSTSQLCYVQDKHFYAGWVMYARAAHFGCFSSIILFILLKLRFSANGTENASVYGSALTIVTVAYLSNILSFGFGWGGVCKDNFGFV